jgi:hypothetical protein
MTAACRHNSQKGVYYRLLFFRPSPLALHKRSSDMVSRILSITFNVNTSLSLSLLRHPHEVGLPVERNRQDNLKNLKKKSFF